MLRLLLWLWAMLGTSEAAAVTIEGRNILVDGQLLYMKGINWSPVKPGFDFPPSQADFLAFAAVDGPRMQEAGINVLRTYLPITDKAVIKKLLEFNIRLIMPVDVLRTPKEIATYVTEMKDEEGILGWALGNEWNYNTLYVKDKPIEECINLINTAASIIKKLDAKPIFSVYGEVPSAALLQRMPDVTAWALNVYRSDSFGDLFEVWQSNSRDTPMPMILGEYGADAFNTLLPGYDPEAQGYATRTLVKEIADHSTLKGGVCTGGLLFEWSDEWWKAPGGLDVQDNTGVAPGGGPYPDSSFNEEWWGISDIHRNYDACSPTATAPVPGCSLRQAFYDYKNAVYPSQPAPTRPTFAPEPTPCNLNFLDRTCLDQISASIDWLRREQSNSCEEDWATAVKDSAQNGMHKKCPGDADLTSYLSPEYRACKKQILGSHPGACRYWGCDADGQWAATALGVTLEKVCPRGIEGKLYRRCGEGGDWGAIVNECSTTKVSRETPATKSTPTESTGCSTPFFGGLLFACAVCVLGNVL